MVSFDIILPTMAEMKNILQNLSKVFQSGKKGSVIGVDVGSSAIKVVQIKDMKGKAVLETYGSLSIGPYADGEVGQVLPASEEQLLAVMKDLFKEANVTTSSAAFSVPASSSLVFMLELPSGVDEKDLPTIINTEARKYIPVPITEVSLDWWKIPKRTDSELIDDAPKPTEKELENEKQRVLVAAIQNDSLNRYNSLVTNSKLDVSMFEIEMFSNARSVLGGDLETTMILDLGASKTKISIVDRGIIQDFHMINRGAQDITTSLATGMTIPFPEAEKMKKEYGLFDNPQKPNAKEIISSSLEYIFFEVNNVVLNYEKKYNKSVAKIILTGGGSLLKGIKQATENKFNTKVVMGNPFLVIEAPAFLQEVLKETGPEFGVAAGLALRKLQ